MGCGPNPWPAYEAIPALSLGFLEWPGSYGAERRGQCYAHGDIPTPSAPVVSPWSPAAGRLFPRCPRPTGSGFSLGNPGWPHPFLPSSCTARAIDRRPGLYPPSPRGGGRAKRAQSRGGDLWPPLLLWFCRPVGPQNAAAPPRRPFFLRRQGAFAASPFASASPSGRPGKDDAARAPAKRLPQAIPRQAARRAARLQSWGQAQRIFFRKRWRRDAARRR